MLRRRSFVASVVTATGLAAGVALLAQTPQQKPPTFRAGVDVSRITVRVLNDKRQPIRGLTEKDFTVIINGVPQPIVTVVAEDEEVPMTPSAPWMRDIAPDVATNSLKDPRLIVIIMDDARADTGKAWHIVQAKLIGKTILDQLGPSDLATVLFTADNRAPQDFTNDRARLLAAMNRFHPTALPRNLKVLYPLNTLRAAIAFLRERPDRRSAIFWVGGGNPKADEYLLPLAIKPEPGGLGLALDPQPLLTNLPAVYPVSTSGFNGGPAAHTSERSIAGATGGRWIASTNMPALEIPDVFRELSLRYTIGYQATEPNPDGRFRRVEVRVHRPDVIVLPRTPSYFAPKAKDLHRVATAERTAPETTLALSGIIPLADEPLRLVVAPFAPAATAANGDAAAAVAVALGVDVPFELGRLGDTLELETRIFDGEGRKEIDVQRHAQVLRPRPGQDQAQYDLLSTLALKPGRYNIRVSMHSTARDRSGSVYTDVVVPDFAKAAWSLSGAVVAMAPALAAVPPGEFRTLLPLVPTTVREFATNDRVTVFLRAYAGGNRPTAPIALRAEIRNTQNAVVFTQSDSVTPVGSTAPRSADYRLALPLARLGPDDYVLSIVAKPPTASEIRRDVRFSVR
jgi:hypothetical protein